MIRAKADPDKLTAYLSQQIDPRFAEAQPEAMRRGLRGRRPFRARIYSGFPVVRGPDLHPCAAAATLQSLGSVESSQAHIEHRVQ